MCMSVCVSERVNKARDYVLQARTERGTGRVCVFYSCTDLCQMCVRPGRADVPIQQALEYEIY